MNSIRNIYCVGRNYAMHAKELNNEIPTSPFLFLKPTHALVQTEGQEIPLPRNKGEIHYEVELVIHIGKPYKQGISVDEIVSTYDGEAVFRSRSILSLLFYAQAVQD